MTIFLTKQTKNIFTAFQVDLKTAKDLRGRIEGSFVPEMDSKSPYTCKDVKAICSQVDLMITNHYQLATSCLSSGVPTAVLETARSKGSKYISSLVTESFDLDKETFVYDVQDNGGVGSETDFSDFLKNLRQVLLEAPKDDLQEFNAALREKLHSLIKQAYSTVKL